MTKLYCLPHAGGTPAGYRTWIKALAPEIEVVPLQHPRPSADEPLSLQDAAKSVVEQCETEEDFAFFGHSLGAVIAFEAVRALSGSPRRLFVCGSAVPPVEASRGRDLRSLPDREFLREVARLGGLPPEIHADAELREEFLPGLRADYTLAETYEYQDGPPIPCPVSAFRGLSDGHVDKEGLNRWGEFTTAGVTAREVPGDHFPLRTSVTFLHRAIRKDLAA